MIAVASTSPVQDLDSYLLASQLLREWIALREVTHPEEVGIAALKRGHERLAESLAAYGPLTRDTLPEEPDAKAAFFAAVEPRVPADVLSFCQQQGLIRHLPIAIRIASDCFRIAGGMTVALASDPDSGEQWVSLEFDASGTVAEILDWGDEHARRMVEEVPWPERTKIRLCYYVA